MRHIVTAMEILWSLWVLVVLFSVDAVDSHGGSQGLSCVNDLINNVSCTWSGATLAPGLNCSISGVTINGKMRTEMIRSCKLEQQGSSRPGCNFVFENKKFFCMRKMPYIRMECDGTLVDNITNYSPCDHIKMHPPGVPTVNSTANDTWISWSADSPRSNFIKDVDYQVQIKQEGQTWRVPHLLSTSNLMLKIPSWQLKGQCQVRVRVFPTKWPRSHWSDWSPATFWAGPADNKQTSQIEGWPLDQMSQVILGVMISFGLLLVGLLATYRSCLSKGFKRKKPVPSPSKYFHTLHSVHGGNLKKWLNPLSAPESFFIVQPRDLISPVEFCGGSEVAPSTSPSSSSTSALLHFKSCPSTGSDARRVADKSLSSSSSGFSNMGYFLSSSSGTSARTDPNPAYFTYKEDFHNLQNSHHLHLSFCPSITSGPIYESLKREPQSPDSGFGIQTEDEDKREDLKAEDVGVLSDDHQAAPLLILPVHLPPQMCPPTFPPPPPNAAIVNQVSSDSQQVDTPAADDAGSYAAWPSSSSMCRSSSMPVEPCRTGYLTLKELQTTFSNKSI